MMYILFFTPTEKFNILCSFDNIDKEVGPVLHVGETRRKVKESMSVCSLTLQELQVIFQSIGLYFDFTYIDMENMNEYTTEKLNEVNAILGSCNTIQRKIVNAMGATDGFNGNDDDNGGKPGEPILPVPSDGGVSMS